MSQSDAVLTREDSVQHGAGRLRGSRLSGFLFHPLLAILAVQAVVSGRLAWVNSAFGDEAHYLADGHVEWQGWLHGTPILVMHDSGAPQIYPPIGAAVAALGGLPLARLLSLAFMLGATALLYATAHRLFGRVAALWAAGLDAFTEPVLRLTFATYDPLSILLLMTAVYVAVRSAHPRLYGVRSQLTGTAGHRRGRPPATSARELRRIAMRLFTTQGFEQTTIDQIAAETGVSERAFFRYSATKASVLFTEFDDEVEQIRAALAQVPGDVPMIDAIRHAVV